MTDFQNIKQIYFIGIGGIGMSALAKYFNVLGIKVSGYDKTHSFVTNQLQELNIPIVYEDNVDLLPQNIDLVIYTPAIPKSHKQLSHLLGRNIPVKKRSEILGIITKNKTSIAIAGTHGKTTISSIITHILKTAGKDIISFMGGISKNYNSNFLISKENDLVVVEADEYDRSFLQLFPDIAVVSAMDADHLDIYGTYENMIVSYNQFIGQIKENGFLVVNTATEKNVSTKIKNRINYSIDKNTTYRASHIKVTEGAYTFDIEGINNKVIKNITLNIGGRHNIENTVAAVAVCSTLNISDDAIRKAISSYSGVMRRFDTRIKHEKLIYIDDYAHHPEELNMLILSVKEIYPHKKITGVFQPHLYSRTRDFADAFAQSLEKLDDVILLDIYPARELPIEGIDSQWLLNKIKHPQKMICTKELLIEELLKRKTDIILTIGAGDIDTMVEPIEKSFKNILKYL